MIVKWAFLKYRASPVGQDMQIKSIFYVHAYIIFTFHFTKSHKKINALIKSVRLWTSRSEDCSLREPTRHYQPPAMSTMAISNFILNYKSKSFSQTYTLCLQYWKYTFYPGHTCCIQSTYTNTQDKYFNRINQPIRMCCVT